MWLGRALVLIKVTDGQKLFERGQMLRFRLGTRAAAFWFEKQGVSFEFAVIALVGSETARNYGVEVGRISSPNWRHAGMLED